MLDKIVTGIGCGCILMGSASCTTPPMQLRPGMSYEEIVAEYQRVTQMKPRWTWPTGDNQTRLIVINGRTFVVTGLPCD